MTRILACSLLIACSPADLITPKYGFQVVASQSNNLLSGEEIDGRFDTFLSVIHDPPRTFPPAIIRFWDDGTLTTLDDKGNQMTIAGQFWSDTWMMEVEWFNSTHPAFCDGPALIHELAHYWQWAVEQKIDGAHRDPIWLAVMEADNQAGCF